MMRFLTGAIFFLCLCLAGAFSLPASAADPDTASLLATEFYQNIADGKLDEAAAMMSKSMEPEKVKAGLAHLKTGFDAGGGVQFVAVDDIVNDGDNEFRVYADLRLKDGKTLRDSLKIVRDSDGKFWIK